MAASSTDEFPLRFRTISGPTTPFGHERNTVETMAGSVGPMRHTVALLDADPDLAAGIEAGEVDAARHRAVAAVLELETPHWDPAPLRSAATGGWLGLLLIDGLLIRRVTVGKRHACELFGPGDLLRPWDTDGDYTPLPISVDWQVLRETRLAVLDTGFMLRISRWPSISSRIVSRVAQRARYLALTQAINHLPRASSRLLILFWLLAERWGTVGPTGVHVPLPLTHEVLAMLIGAQRPTVTLALQRLARTGLLTRESRDRWLLTRAAIDHLGAPESLNLIESVDPAAAARLTSA
jgi:CRP/FNR family transcriptional regulator, cyclic AMP receptor protein